MHSNVQIWIYCIAAAAATPNPLGISDGICVYNILLSFSLSLSLSPFEMLTTSVT